MNKYRYKQERPLVTAFTKSDQRITKKVKHKDNPFTEAIIRSRYITSKSFSVEEKENNIEEASDEEQKWENTLRYKYKDSRPYLTMFINNIHFMKNMSASEHTLMQYIFFNLEQGNDMVNITPMDVHLETDMSMPTVYKALDGLIERAIVARSYKMNIYFINTLLFFCGRVDIYIDNWLRCNPKFDDLFEKNNKK